MSIARDIHPNDATPSFWEVVKVPAFLFFWLGRIVSSFGDILFQMAMMWYILGRTHSPLSTAVIPIIPMLTSVFFSQPMATLADRLPKKSVMVGSDIFRALVVLCVALGLWLNQLNSWELYVTTFLLTTSGFLFGPAQNASLPKMLPNPERHLSVANSLIRATSQFINLFGYAMGGVVISILHPTNAVIIDGFSFFISALFLLFLPIPKLCAKGKEGAWGFLSDSVAGIRFIWRRPAIRTFGLFVTLINFVLGPISIFTVVFSRLVLHSGLHGYGYLEASWAVGGVAGAIVATWFSKKLKLFHLTLIALLGTGLALASMPVAHNLVEAILASIFSSVVVTMLNIPVFTALQLLAPDEIRGRVMAGFGLFASVGDPLGLFVGSLVMKWVSPSPVFLISGLLLTVCGLLSAAIPSIRRSQGELTSGS